MVILVLNVFKVNKECLRYGNSAVNFDKIYHKIYQTKIMFLFMTLNIFVCLTKFTKYSFLMFFRFNYLGIQAVFLYEYEKT